MQVQNNSQKHYVKKNNKDFTYLLGYEFGGSGSCKGDSGGPLMRYTYDNGPASAKFVQQGIVQGGVGTCGSKDFPSIYVRIRDPEVFEFIQISLAGR